MRARNVCPRGRTIESGPLEHRECMTETTAISRQSVRTRNITFLAVFAAAVVLSFRGLWDYDPDSGIRGAVGDIEGWFFSPTGRSPVFILSVSVLLFWGRFPRMLAAIRASKPSPVWAAAFLAPGSALQLWSYYTGAPDLLVPALILMILGCSLAVSGAMGFRAFLLPALFLVLAIPPPAVLINQVIYPLQLITAETVVWILERFNFTVALQSDLIFTPKRIFQVIENCSGLRSMETITMAALLYGELFYRHRAQVVILFLAAPFISFIANQLRVLSIVLNPFSEVGSVHTVQGLVVLVGSVLTLALLDHVLSKVLAPPKVPRPRPKVAKWAALPEKSIVVLSAIFMALGAMSFALPKWEPAPRVGRTLSDFPLVLRGWKSDSKEVDTQFLGTVKFSERQSRTYTRGANGPEFDLFVGIDEHYQRNFSLISDKTETLRSGWVVDDRLELTVPGTEVVGHRLMVSFQGKRSLVYHWYLNVDSGGEELVRSALALDRSFLRRPIRSTVVNISAPIAHDGSNLDEVEARLRTFAPLVQEAVVALQDRTWSRELRQKLADPDDL
jgi:exosortase